MIFAPKFLNSAKDKIVRLDSEIDLTVLGSLLMH